MDTARKSDLIDVACTQHAETDKAVLISDSGEKDDAVWLPKSQIEIEHNRGESFITVTLPEWLAMDKGLI